jgi:hypothetical protein
MKEIGSQGCTVGLELFYMAGLLFVRIADLAQRLIGVP